MNDDDDDGPTQNYEIVPYAPTGEMSVLDAMLQCWSWDQPLSRLLGRASIVVSLSDVEANNLREYYRRHGMEVRVDPMQYDLIVQVDDVDG